MIRFLSKIRRQLLTESKFSKYLLYAIGEIILVVIGILIALQINNWNEERKENNRIVKYAKSLAQDLEEDIVMIDTIKYIATQISFRIDSLSNYIRNKQIEEISNLTVVCLTWVSTYRPYSWNRATLDELKSSGSLRLVKNDELSKKIVKYDTFTHHMDEDYYTDKVLSDDAIQLLSRVINENYPNFVEQLGEILRVSANSGQLNDVFSDPIYKKAEDYNLSFITKDMEALNNATNNFIRLKSNLNVRTKIELPQLVEDARELIKLLKEEYSF